MILQMSVLSLFLSFQIVGINSASLASEQTLKLLHVVFRHGDRSPDAGSLYPNDPHKNDTWYPIGLGALTLRGQMQEYEIGKALRKTYNNFLGQIYTPTVLEARSTWFNRTKMSLELVLAGLWPPNTKQVWNEELHWIPIPYNYDTEDNPQDFVVPTSQCPKFNQLYDKITEEDEVQDYLKSNADLINYINVYSGLECANVRCLFDLYFTLYSENATGRVLPSWTAKVFPNFLEQSAIFEYHIQTSTYSMRKTCGGRFIRKVIKDSKTMIEGSAPADRKIFLYSGHEVNIAHILTALNVFNNKVPAYASYIVFELHKIQNNYAIRVLHQDTTKEVPAVLKIPGCEELCPFDKFVELTKHVIPNNINDHSCK